MQVEFNNVKLVATKLAIKGAHFIYLPIFLSSQFPHIQYMIQFTYHVRRLESLFQLQSMQTFMSASTLELSLSDLYITGKFCKAYHKWQAKNIKIINQFAKYGSMFDYVCMFIPVMCHFRNREKFYVFVFSGPATNDDSFDDRHSKVQLLGIYV